MVGFTIQCVADCSSTQFRCGDNEKSVTEFSSHTTYLKQKKIKTNIQLLPLQINIRAVQELETAIPKIHRIRLERRNFFRLL